MSQIRFKKQLTANDTGETESHQAGILIPKTQSDLVSFLPFLDPKIKNPDAFIVCVDDQGISWNFRYVYYNNKLHDLRGTRNEYRITHMTKFFRSVGAKKDDILYLSRESGISHYKISVRSPRQPKDLADNSTGTIKLTGWRKDH